MTQSSPTLSTFNDSDSAGGEGRGDSTEFSIQSDTTLKSSEPLTSKVPLAELNGASENVAPELDLNSSNSAVGGFFLTSSDDTEGGRSVSNAGDINGDGLDDIIIGNDRGNPNGNRSGESYVVFGNANGFSSSLNLTALDGTDGFVIKGIDPLDNSGRAVTLSKRLKTAIPGASYTLIKSSTNKVWIFWEKNGPIYFIGFGHKCRVCYARNGRNPCR